MFIRSSAKAGGVLLETREEQAVDELELGMYA